jgi:hypothetical protein
MMKRSAPIYPYYFEPLLVVLAHFMPPMGQIGVHQLPKIVRVELYYSGCTSCARLMRCARHGSFLRASYQPSRLARVPVTHSFFY